MKNPIRSVDGAAIPCPSSYLYLLDDVSAPDAGRFESGMMDKMRVGQVVGLNLSWNAINSKTASLILNLFDPEYFVVDYFDLKRNNFVKKEFYAGNRSAPMYNAELDLWDNLSFNIIMRDGGKII